MPTVQLLTVSLFFLVRPAGGELIVGVVGQITKGDILFTLAVVNNHGMLHRQLNDEEAPGNCFEYVLSTLIVLIDCGEANVSQIDGFIINATRLISQPCVAAVAFHSCEISNCIMLP